MLEDFAMQEREVARRVLERYSAEQLGRIIARAVEACAGVVVAYRELEKVGFNPAAADIVWQERVREFLARLSKLEALLAERERFNGIGEALKALESETEGGAEGEA